ncbi:MAG: hypothetical protein ABIN55_10480 [Aeromicrobium sp.]
MLRTLSALLLIATLGACGSDPKTVDPLPSKTVKPVVTPTPTPTPTPKAVAGPTKTVAPIPKKTVKPKPVLSPCATIWQAGATLPASYNGCAEQPGENAWEVDECNSGGQYATYDDTRGRFVAKLGGPIFKRNAAVDGDYESTYESCTGEG